MKKRNTSRPFERWKSPNTPATAPPCILKDPPGEPARLTVPFRSKRTRQRTAVQRAHDVQRQARRLAGTGLIAAGRRDGVRCEVHPGHIAKAQAQKSAPWRRRWLVYGRSRPSPCPSCSCNSYPEAPPVPIADWVRPNLGHAVRVLVLGTPQAVWVPSSAPNSPV